jgi:hypothetical protein
MIQTLDDAWNCYGAVRPDTAIERLRRYLARLEEVEKAATMGLPPIVSGPETASEPE